MEIADSTAGALGTMFRWRISVATGRTWHTNTHDLSRLRRT